MREISACAFKSYVKACRLCRDGMGDEIGSVGTHICMHVFKYLQLLGLYEFIVVAPNNGSLKIAVG